MKYMQERRKLCEMGRKLWERGMVSANDGNLSLRCDKDRYLITPAGVSKGAMTPDMMILVNGAGEPLDEGCPWEPSSELGLHLMCYDSRPGVGGVCHTHAPAATAFACCRRPLEADCLSEAVMSHGAVPCAPYGKTGTPALVKAAAPYVATHDAVLLANHGVLTLGRTLEEAYATMERVEHTAKISLYLAQLGGGVPLSAEEKQELRKK